MPKFSKGHNSGYKVAFPIAIFTGGKGFYVKGVGGGGEGITYFPGGGENSTTGKLHSHFSGGGVLVADNHSRFSGGGGGEGENWVYDRPF